MKLRPNRTVITLLLVVPAISLPCLAWYFAGTKAAEGEAGRYVKFAELRVFEVAMGLSQRLEGHFQALVESEARRPVYHYQPHFHDPTSSCECASVTPSPLTQGSPDPIVMAHFEIDAQGRVTIPTLPVDPAMGESEKWRRSQKQILKMLRPLPEVLATSKSNEFAASSPSGSWSDGKSEQRGAAGAHGEGSRSADVRDQDSPGADASEAERQVWTKSQTSEPVSPIGTADFYPGAGREYVYERSYLKGTASAFVWHTVTLDDRPRLIALRQISSPDGDFRQGFIISSKKVNASMQGAAYPAAFLPGMPSEGNDESRLVQAIVDLPGAAWRVSVNAGDALDSAWALGEEVKAGFKRNFIWVSAASLLASICIVGLVWQADRLALQRQRFSASAAHELRTPLAGLRVYGDMLADGLGDPARSRDYARQISAEAERLGRVVSNVLGYTRLERGATLVHAEPGDLADAVRDCVQRFEAALQAAGASVELAIADNLPRVRFDRDAIFHIMQNLLDNAEKYSRPAADRRIHVKLIPNGDGRAVELSVSDHGPGIRRDVRRQLFRPFTRTADKDAPPGLGLGLTLVQKLAREHSGKVRHSEAEGGGSVFTVTLPAEGPA